MRLFAAITLAVGLASVSNEAQGQRSVPVGFRSAVSSAKATGSQPSSDRPTITWQAGIAVGEGSFDIGFTAGASILWDVSALPFDLRFDPSLSRFTADVGPAASASIVMINLPGAIEYEFENSGSSSARMYVMGGVGLHYRNFSVDVSSPGISFGVGDSGLDLGITVGGGVRLNSHFSVEARLVDAGGFTSFPLLIGWRP